VTLPALAIGFLAAYAAVLWRWFRPTFLQNWREADTQTIALHLAEPGGNIFYPRIDWGGDGPGYVETEFQLYPWLVSWFLRVLGPVEWPGQLISLAAVVGAAYLVFRGLTAHYGSLPAALGTLTLLAPRTIVLMATSVQPEALCLLLFAAAWFSFLRYESTGERRALVAYAALGTLAMLVKPTAGQLGIATFALLALRSRERLRTKDPWLAWAFMVGLVGLHLWHGFRLFVEFGNSFGVLGGDSKFPRLEHLLTPSILRGAAVNLVLWGTGPVGAVAIAAVLLRRQGAAPIAALLLSNVAWALLALRYASGYAGFHYHLLAAITAAHAVAHVASAFSDERWRHWARGLCVLALVASLHRSLLNRRWFLDNPFDAPAIAAARALSRHATAGTLVVIRSVEGAFDPFWKMPSNFQDPRVFYLSRTHGWPIGLEDTAPELIAAPARRGARFYVETIPPPASAELESWLTQNAHLVETTEHGGRVFRLATK
jgi:hypothetical protein